jgi:predicted SprT family Zn-dependent metalloprotease
MAHIMHQNETVAERDIRVNEILRRNSRPFECDFCPKTFWKAPTNIGSAEEKIYACKTCIKRLRLLA